MEKEFRKLPNEVLKKMLYDKILEKNAKNVKMYLRVNNIRKKALYESIKNDLSGKSICNDYKVFCLLIDNDIKRDVGVRAALFDYLNNKLDVNNWYATFLQEIAELDTNITNIVSILNNNSIEQKRKYTTEDAIFKEMLSMR